MSDTPAPGVQGSGVRVQCFELRVRGAGFLGFWSAGFRVRSEGCGV